MNQTNSANNTTSQVTAPPKRPKASAMLKSAVKDARENPSVPIVGTDWNLLSKYTGYNPQKPVAITQEVNKVNKVNEVNEVKATQEVICLKFDFFKTATGICKPDVKSDSESEYESEEPEDLNNPAIWQWNCCWCLVQFLLVVGHASLRGAQCRQSPARPGCRP